MLGANEIEIQSQTDARKERIEAEAAWQMISQASKLYVAKGRKVLEFVPAADDKAVILKEVMGRSGNLRAPTLRVANELFVGFNEELYTSNFGKA